MNEEFDLLILYDWHRQNWTAFPIDMHICLNTFQPQFISNLWQLREKVEWPTNWNRSLPISICQFMIVSFLKLKVEPSRFNRESSLNLLKTPVKRKSTRKWTFLQLKNFSENKKFDEAMLYETKHTEKC